MELLDAGIPLWLSGVSHTVLWGQQHLLSHQPSSVGFPTPSRGLLAASAFLTVLVQAAALWLFLSGREV